MLIPVLLAGGTEVQTLYLVRALSDAGYSVGICCYFEASESIVRNFEREGARITLLRLGPSDEAKKPRTLLRVGWQLLGHFRRIRPDVVHVQYIAPGLLPIVVARLARVPTVLATVHQPGHPYGSRARFFLRLAARLSSAFFCVSRSVEASWFGESTLFGLADVGKRRHFTLYDCVDVDRFAQGAERLDTSASREELGLSVRPVVGTVGRLRHEKGHAALLEAVSLVRHSIPDVALLVVGDGPDRAELEARAQTLGFGDRVVWLGARAPEEVLRLYGVMDVVAVPSVFEGFGLVAAEAMAAGKPVVAFSVGGLPEVIDHGVTGHLVEPGDVKGLSAAIVHVLSHPVESTTMGLQGRERVREHFSYERYSNLIVLAYHSLAKDRGAAN